MGFFKNKSFYLVSLKLPFTGKIQRFLEGISIIKLKIYLVETEEIILKKVIANSLHCDIKTALLTKFNEELVDMSCH